ncbi:MAG TPA: GNAT family N-acetyltransferase [Chloroflexota bacterium]|nr:GNAT family N-acetyltransferase [Chloroflexota bacterium]
MSESKRRQLRMLLPHLDDLPALDVPTGYHLRTFQPGDERAWGEIMESTGGLGTEWTIERVRERMIHREQFDPAGMFFATSDAEAGRPVASATAWRASADERVLGNVHMVCALDSHRGRGLGRLVTLAVLHRLRDQGFQRADLSTDDWRLSRPTSD